MSQSGQRRRRAPWENDERHYCALCNAWMGSDRQSILIHENGRKHREAVEEDLQRRRLDRAQEEKDRSDQAAALRRIEKMAAAAVEKDVASGAFGQLSSVAPSAPAPVRQQPLGGVGGAAASVPAPAPQPKAAAAPRPNKVGGKGAHAAKLSEMDSWQARKQKREEARVAQSGGSAEDGEPGEATAPRAKRRKIKLGEDEGHYTVGVDTYLEGKYYASIVEPDVPAQIWIGPEESSETERRSVHRQELWKTGLVVKVRRSAGKDNESADVTFDIAYLRQPDDEDETLEKSVRPERIRLALGSDDALPSTIEEARLELMGGEEVIEVQNADGKASVIDEDTGLGSWGTVTVRRVTATKDVKEERARIRAKKREEAERERDKEREVQARRMEEARHANADDSALGSYDVWSGGKGGYKGVNIHAEAKLQVADTAKSLAKGNSEVKFKKRGAAGGGGSLFKKTKKQNRRVTSADDD